MNRINNWEELQKKGSDKYHKSTQEISQTLDNSEGQIPNWKVFNIKEIADINPWTNQMIVLKNVKVWKDWEKYIVINWRKYYEYKWQWEPKDSIYVLKWSSLFIWDKFEWLSNRDGVAFRYTIGIGENISFMQQKAKYMWWAMQLKDIYKSESIYAGEVVAIIRHSWKLIRITKDLIDKYINWWLSKTSKDMVEIAIRLNPDILAYIENNKS